MAALSNWKTYFKLAWACKTPLVLLADKKYKAVSELALVIILRNGKGLWKQIEYKVDEHDCDDAADIIKGEASRHAENGVGRVYGYWRGHGWHYWTVVIKNSGVVMIEPQTSGRNRKWGEYIPIVVMI